MIAAGLGFGFMPEHTAKHPGVVALPIIDPEFWREVNLVTVRGRMRCAPRPRAGARGHAEEVVRRAGEGIVRRRVGLSRRASGLA